MTANLFIPAYYVSLYTRLIYSIIISAAHHQMAGELLKLFEEELDNPTRESLEKTGLTLVSFSEMIIVLFIVLLFTRSSR